MLTFVRLETLFFSTKNPSVMRTISIKMGLWMLAGFISFFLLMFVMGLGHRSELRVFNGVIHVYCLYRAIKAYYALHPENIANYMMGVGQGMGASIIGVGGFTVFMTIFLALNPTFMMVIRNSSPLGPYLHPFTASLFILTEGLVVSLIGSYILTRVLEMNTKKL